MFCLLFPFPAMRDGFIWSKTMVSRIANAFFKAQTILSRIAGQRQIGQNDAFAQCGRCQNVKMTVSRTFGRHLPGLNDGVAQCGRLLRAPNDGVA
jgi:hypothetical protein